MNACVIEFDDDTIIELSEELESGTVQLGLRPVVTPVDTRDKKCNSESL